MAAGDYIETTWVNNTTPAINQTNLNNVEDKISEMDDLLKRTNTIDFKDFRKYCIDNNTKEINIFDDYSDWTANNATLSDEQSFFNMHTQAVRVLEPDNSAGVVGMYQTLGSTMDLTTFKNGSDGTTADLIVIYLYVSDAAAVNYVELILGDDSTDNYSETWSGLTTGYNVLTAARSAFTTNNSPTGWDSIDYIACNWYSNANYQNDYISWNYCTMIREDPDNSGYYNEFQYYDGSSYQNIFSGNLSQYFLVFDRRYSEIILFRHSPADDETELHLYCECIDFVAKVLMRAAWGGDTGNALTWWVDADNYIEVYVDSDTLTLFHREAASNGTETIAMDISSGDILDFYIEKTGQTIRLLCTHEDNVYSIEYATAISATDEGCLYFGGTSTTSYAKYKDFIFSNTQGHRLENIWDRPVMKRKRLEETVTSSTTMQNDNELYMSLPSHGRFKIELFLVAKSASTTPDIKLDWSITGDFKNVSYRYSLGPGTGTTDLTNTNMHNGYYFMTTTVSYGLEGTSDESLIQESFVIETQNEEIEIQLRWAQNVSNATATVVLEGSYLLATKLNTIL